MKGRCLRSGIGVTPHRTMVLVVREGSPLRKSRNASDTIGLEEGGHGTAGPVFAAAPGTRLGGDQDKKTGTIYTVLGI